MNFTPNPQKAFDKSLLREFLGELKNGARVSWVEIEQGTGIKMDRRGQPLVRAVLKETGREYLALPGHGIEMSSPDNALDIVAGRLRRVDNALSVATKVTANVVSQHLEAMPSDRRQEILRTQALLSTLRFVGEGGRKPRPALPVAPPAVPGRRF